MKNVLLTPNPYRDRNFTTVRSAIQILLEAGDASFRVSAL